MKVSIIVPIYLDTAVKLHYFELCVDSILAQTYKDYEVIIVDDASPKPYAEEVRGLCDNHGFLLTVLPKNRGIGSARHIGVTQSSADYTYFIGGDDEMMPETLEVFVNAAKKYPGMIFYSHYAFIDANGKELGKANAPSFKRKRDFKIACWKNALMNTMFVCFAVIFIPTKLIKKHNILKSLRFGEDLEWVLRMALVEDCEFALVNAHLARYRVHPESTSTKEKDKIASNNVKIRKRIKTLMLKKKS